MKPRLGCRSPGASAAQGARRRWRRCRKRLLVLRVKGRCAHSQHSRRTRRDRDSTAVVLQDVDPPLRGQMRSYPPPTDATPKVLIGDEAWSAQRWLKQGLDLLRRSKKWNFKPRVEYELDAHGGLFWTRMTANSRLEQFKALAYDAFRDARFKFRRCPECQRPFVPVRRQEYCSAGCSQAVRTRKWRKAHPERNRAIRRQQ